MAEPAIIDEELFAALLTLARNWHARLIVRVPGSTYVSYPAYT